MDALRKAVDSETRYRTFIDSILDGTAPNEEYTELMLLVDMNLAKAFTWHNYSELPTDLTKHDILMDTSYYDGTDTEDGTPVMKEFKADYPALYKALTDHIKTLVPQAKAIKPTQHNKPFISWGELADLGIHKYVTSTTSVSDIDIVLYMSENEEDTLENYLKRRRIIFTGIQIAKAPRENQLTESGAFKDRIETIILPVSDKSIDSIAKNERQIHEIIEFQNHLFKPALRYMYAFNALVQILEAVYDIDGLGEATLKTDLFEGQLSATNSMLYMLYAKAYGPESEKERKRELIKEIFSRIEYERLKPTQEVIDEVTADLNKKSLSTEAIKKIKCFDGLIERLGGGRL